jgi:HEPN domain-containing protein
MTAQKRTDAFFTLAERGVAVANVLFAEDKLEDAALYVQQTAERVARALLTHAGIHFGTSHNLAQMAEALPAEHPFRERIRSFDDFSTAVTAFRYPSPTGRLKEPPQAGHLEKRLADVEQLVKDAKSFVYGPNAKAGPTGTASGTNGNKTR